MKGHNPTPSELEILQILWQNGPSTVKFIHRQIEQTKEVGYTTILKIMQLMAEKGMLSREVKGKAHIYTSEINEDATQGALLDKFLEKTFRGSASKLILKALGNEKTTKEDLIQIKKYINSIKSK